MLFMVHLLVTLNITISFFNAVCKQAFFRLRMATIVISTKCNSNYDYDFDYVMK